MISVPENQSMPETRQKVAGTNSGYEEIKTVILTTEPHLKARVDPNQKHIRTILIMELVQ